MSGQYCVSLAMLCILPGHAMSTHYLRFELAITLYTEAMRYAPCNPVLLEGEALAGAAANR